MAEMLTYAPDLRSITGGRGDYTMEFLRYEEVPGAPRAEGRRQLARGGGDGLAARRHGAARGPPRGYPRGLDSAPDLDAARDRHVRGLRPLAAARRARRRLPARRRAPPVCELCTPRAVHEGWIREGADAAPGRVRGWSRGGGAGFLERLRQRRRDEDVELLRARGRREPRRGDRGGPLRGAAAGPRARAGARAVAEYGAAAGAAALPRGPAGPRDPDERRHEGRARDRAVQRQPASAHRQRALAHARRTARQRAPVADRGQHRDRRRRLGAVLVPLRDRPRRRGRRRAADRPGRRARRARRGRIATPTRSSTSTAYCIGIVQPA